MDIIIILVGILILTVFIFFLIEYPYYLVSLFVFLHLYSFNWEIPGPLDLRGLISVVSFMRLVIFDKNNIDLLRKSMSNKFLVLIIVFSLYTALINFANNVSLISILRLLILNIVALLLGFLTIINGYAKKTIVLAILITGVFAFGDLVYSYFTIGTIRVRRIIEHAILGQFLTTMNHNFFGELCGFALITVFLLFITKNIDKKISYALFIIFILGMLISTSRMTFLSVTATLVIILLTRHGLVIDFKKVFASLFIGVLLIGVVALSYKYLLSATNIKSEFADQIYWRLVEEPLSFFEDDYVKFDAYGRKIEGSITWRFNKTLIDANTLYNLDINKFLFGFGTGGYSNIVTAQFIGQKAYLYASHNFYTNLVAEVGIVGLLLFMLFFLSLLWSTIKLVKKGSLQFSLVYLLVYMLMLTIGGSADLTGKFGFILYGCVIADLIQEQDIWVNLPVMNYNPPIKDLTEETPP